MWDQDFVDRIHAMPELDAPRREYATWLMSQGDPKGMFITNQLRLNSMATTTPEWINLNQQVREAFLQMKSIWLPWWYDNNVGPSTVIFWRRGWIDQINATLRDWNNAAEAKAYLPLKWKIKLGGANDKTLRYVIRSVPTYTRKLVIESRRQALKSLHIDLLSEARQLEAVELYNVDAISVRAVGYLDLPNLQHLHVGLIRPTVLPILKEAIAHSRWLPTWIKETPPERKHNTYIWKCPTTTTQKLLWLSQPES